MDPPDDQPDEKGDWSPDNTVGEARGDGSEAFVNVSRESTASGVLSEVPVDSGPNMNLPTIAGAWIRR